MKQMSLAVLGTAGFLFVIAAPANAANSFIVIKGCAHWAPPFCTNIGQGGNTYSLLGASPPVPLNVGVTVVGTKSGDLSLCFGIPIKVIKWSRNRMRCPK